MTQRVTDSESNYHTYLDGVDNDVTLTMSLSPLACAIGPGAWLLPVLGDATVTTGSLLLIVSLNLYVCNTDYRIPCDDTEA